jgi:hypothetical protein
MRNKKRARGSPCFSSLLMLTHSVEYPLTKTDKFPLHAQVFIHTVISLQNPFYATCTLKEAPTHRAAFLKSTLKMTHSLQPLCEIHHLIDHKYAIGYKPTFDKSRLILWNNRLHDHTQPLRKHPTLYKLPNKKIGWKSLIWRGFGVFGINVKKYDEKIEGNLADPQKSSNNCIISIFKMPQKLLKKEKLKP